MRVSTSPRGPASQHRGGVCVARVYQTSDADNSQAGNLWFQRWSSLTPPRASLLPGSQGTTLPRVPPHCSGRPGQVGGQQLPGALGPEGGRGCPPWSSCCLPQAPELSPSRDKAAPGEACSARGKTKPPRHQGKPSNGGLSKAKQKTHVSSQPTSWRRRPLGCPLQAGVRRVQRRAALHPGLSWDRTAGLEGR